MKGTSGYKMNLNSLRNR